jgi:hypothetical protein
MPQKPRLVGLAGAVWGGVLLVWGDDVWRALERRDPGDTERLVTRVLGVRHLVQGIAQAALPTAVSRPAVLVDVAHAVTMLPLVAAPAHRRPALLSGGVALLAALATAATADGIRPRPRGRHRAG